VDAKPRISTLHVCEYRCGWKRDITDTTAWQEQKIDHPRYGEVTNLFAAECDINDHNCGTYLAAKDRSPRAHEKKVNYRRYTDYAVETTDTVHTA
jgi:hypothetical protein